MYTFTSKGVHINVKGAPQGINMPETWVRIGLTLALREEVADTVTWFGRGLGEAVSITVKGCKGSSKRRENCC
jgi:beta-galactosidase